MLAGSRNGVGEVRLGGTTLHVPDRGLPPGEAVLAVRPEAIRVRRGDGEGVRGSVRKASYLGKHMEYELVLDGLPDEVFVTDQDVGAPLQPGERVVIAIAPGGAALVRGVSDLEARRDCAIALALEAGALAQAMWSSLGPAESKSAIDFCTEADRAVEELIRTRVTTRFGDAVIGEEGGGEPGQNVWLVDPIDGTTGYIHGDGRWCISLAFVRAGHIEIGVIYAPVSGRLFLAQRGMGATLNGRPMSVSNLAHGTGPLVEVGWSDRRPLSAYCGVLQGLNADGIEFRRHGSGALALADVALGVCDGYVELHINAWDALAGILLVQEAGGRTNDFLADNGITRGNLLVATTPELHDRVQRIVAMATHAMKAA